MFSKILIFSFAVFLMGLPVQAQDIVGSLRSISGDVDLIRGETTQPANVGMDLMEGDVLITGINSSAGLTFLDGTRISIGAESELVMNNYRFVPINEEYAFDVYMKQGSAAYSSGRLGHLAPETVRFHTPQATLGIRGTFFMVRVE